MKCASPDCANPELTATDPCTVCSRGVHHLCSNDIYDAGDLSVRFCSAACVYRWNTVNPPGTTTASCAQLDAFASERVGDDSERSVGPLSQQTESSLGHEANLQSSQDSVELGSPVASPNLVAVDEHDIPLDVLHYRQLGRRDEIWNVAHILATPYASGTDDDLELFTHVCLLCAANLTSKPIAAMDAWEGALRRFSHTSNAKEHFAAMHSTHPLGKLEVDKKIKQKRRQLDAALSETDGPEPKRNVGLTHSESVSKKQGLLKKLWAPTQKELNVYVARWLINDGLAHSTVTTDAFKLLLQRATGNPDVTILAPSTYRNILEASFRRFCEMLAVFLLEELDAAHGAPFLNVHHDLSTLGHGKTGVMGTSITFIDRFWVYHSFALLATVHNGDHSASTLKALITARVLKLYNIDIDKMAQFTVSDTAAGARKVSKLFEDSVPTDCSMHALNLCLLYAMGMRENMESVLVVDPVTKIETRERRICTPGGPFLSGAKLIKKIRDLNNYFSSPQRVDRLAKVQEFYGLPLLRTIVDCDTRVASTVMLFQRTIVNYTALRAYFQHGEKDDDSSVFDSISFAEWRLMSEIEAITRSIADLALVESQRSEQVSSELIVLIKFATDRVSATTYDVCDIDAPRTSKTREDSFPRFTVPLLGLSTGALTCIDRLKSQLRNRLSPLTPETVLILLLDPRTKFSVESLVRPTSISERKNAQQVSDQAAAEIEKEEAMLLEAHREVDCAMHAVDVPSNGCTMETGGSTLCLRTLTSVNGSGQRAARYSPQSRLSRECGWEEATPMPCKSVCSPRVAL